MSSNSLIYPHEIKACIFDVDGTVLDTLPIYWKANTLTMGKEFPPEFQPVVNGCDDIDEANIIIKHFDLKMETQEFIKTRISHLTKLLPESELMPGIGEIIEKVDRMGLPMAVATSSHRVAYNIKISKHKELFSKFKAVVCGNEISKGKPSPEIFLTAAKKLGDINPENILIFEDAAFGVKAACDGGFPCVILRTTEGNLLVEKLNKLGAKPTLIIDSFNDFSFNTFKFANRQ